jgi:hypothetical protein
MHARTHAADTHTTSSWRARARERVFSLAVFLSGVPLVASSRIGSPLRARCSLYLSFSLTLSTSRRRRRVSQMRSPFLASAESPPTGVTTIDYRRVRGVQGRCAGTRDTAGADGGTGVARGWHCGTAGIIAIHGSLAERRPYNSGSVPRGREETRRISHSPWPSSMALSLLPVSSAYRRRVLPHFSGGWPRRCRRPPVNPGCPADTRQRCGEPTGWIDPAQLGRSSVLVGRSMFGPIFRYLSSRSRGYLLISPEEIVTGSAVIADG